MVNVNLFTRLLHVCNDVFDLVKVQSLSSRRENVLIVRASCVLVDKRLIDKTSLGVSFGFGGIFAIGLALGDLSHLRFFACDLDQILTVSGEFSNLVTFKTCEHLLERIECFVCVQLESNSRQEIVGLQLRHNIVQVVADILLRLKGRRFLRNAELFIKLGVGGTELRETIFQPGLVLLCLIQSDTLAFVNILIEKVVWVVQILQNSGWEH
mmetsp:Transcript_12625/g.26068  ORF Transcript_12625/g.26068 Transcript_12625/m.26068 type:complete len:211 (-) Transcript_12625:1512-2144(-)